jgi:hypothetical protein
MVVRYINYTFISRSLRNCIRKWSLCCNFSDFCDYFSICALRLNFLICGWCFQSSTCFVWCLVPVKKLFLDFFRHFAYLWCSLSYSVPNSRKFCNCECIYSLTFSAFYCSLRFFVKESFIIQIFFGFVWCLVLFNKISCHRKKIFLHFFGHFVILFLVHFRHVAIGINDFLILFGIFGILHANWCQWLFSCLHELREKIWLLFIGSFTQTVLLRTILFARQVCTCIRCAQNHSFLVSFRLDSVIPNAIENPSFLWFSLERTIAVLYHITDSNGGMYSCKGVKISIFRRFIGRLHFG